MAIRMLRDNWRLLVLAAIVGATSFAGAYVLSATSDETAPPAPPARSVPAGGVRVPSQVSSFGELHAVVADAIGPGVGGPGGYTDFVEARDDAGAIAVEVPAAWTDTRALPWLDDDGNEIGTSVVSSPLASRFYQAWDTPGVFVGASREVAADGADGLLDRGRAFHAQHCLAAGRGGFDGENHVGRYEVWYDCAEMPTVVVSLALHPRDAPDMVVAVYVKLVTAYDLAALERILETLSVDPAALE